MDTKAIRLNRQRKVRPLGAIRGSFALLMAISLVFAPLLMYSKEVRTFCAEYGNMPVPLAEEEEVHHFHPCQTDTPKGHSKCPELKGQKGPHSEENPHRSTHGDVPHLPPWGMQ